MDTPKFRVDPEAPMHVIDETGATVAISCLTFIEDRAQDEVERLERAKRIAALLNATPSHNPYPTLSLALGRKQGKPPCDECGDEQKCTPKACENALRHEDLAGGVGVPVSFEERDINTKLAVTA